MSREEHAHLLDALEALDPATLDYTDWTICGMALKKSGYAWSDWDTWSRRDPRRWHEGECERKWETFENERDFGTVSAGTLIHMATTRVGWTQPGAGLGSALGWGDSGTVTAGPDASAADSMPIMDADEGDWNPCKMLSDYLGALFEDSDVVGYVCDTWMQDGVPKPRARDWSRTAGQLRQELAKPTATMDKVIGAWDEVAGAWIHFNPLDGHGCGNANVTDFRYALVESDVLDVDKQLPAIKDMRLPCAAVVSSGGKSVHAIVRVDAKDKDEYSKRVKWLYDYCDRHGFVCDKQNKNASRLSRMPGVTRNGRRQLLLATNIGEPDWESWKRWAEESEDDLPDEVVGGIGTPARLKPMLIGLTDDDCILRQMAKMIVVGDSKMGKSYTLIDLAEAICVGGEWLGMQCARGKVYYINMELEEQEFLERQNKVWDERPESGEDGMLSLVNANFVHMPMRGNASELWDIQSFIVRRVLRYGPPGTFVAIIIDPIYKVNGGDDNDARAVAKFTNTLDAIVQACGCAVIYAHHHPKGATGNRRTIDRMSGSGVYGRDADTVVDFSPLFCPDEDLRKRWGFAPMFRAEIKCRSFGYRKPIDAVFAHPRFVRDTEGKLAHLKILGEDPSAEGRARGAQATSDKAKDAGWNRLLALNDAFDNNPTDDFPDAVEFDEEFVSGIRWGAFGIGDKPSLTTVSTWVKGTSKAKFVPAIQEHFEFVQTRNKTYLRRLKEPETDDG